MTDIQLNDTVSFKFNDGAVTAKITQFSYIEHSNIRVALFCAADIINGHKFTDKHFMHGNKYIHITVNKLKLVNV